MTEEEIIAICRDNVHNEIDIDTEINTENGFDSLSIMNIIVEIEERCGVIPDDYVIKINEAKNVGEVLKIVNWALDVNQTSNCVEKRKELINIVNEEKEILFNNVKEGEYYPKKILSENKCFVEMGNGGISFTGVSAALFDFFDYRFQKIAKSNRAVEEKYPVLLSYDTLYKTGYTKRYPNYSMNLKQEELVLSPSACFHVYEKYKDTTLSGNSSFTFLQNVFRNEKKSRMDEFGRLRDYHVREVVFIGDEIYVDSSINKMIEQTKEFIKEIGLKGSIESATDFFVSPNMQRYKLIQMHNRAKYEVNLNYETDKELSAASFNRHGKAFSEPFNINVSEAKNVVSGCVGYGIERWVLAFMSQYGCEPDNMPGVVRNYISDSSYHFC